MLKRNLFKSLIILSGLLIILIFGLILKKFSGPGKKTENFNSTFTGIASVIEESGDIYLYVNFMFDNKSDETLHFLMGDGMPNGIGRNKKESHIEITAHFRCMLTYVHDCFHAKGIRLAPGKITEVISGIRFTGGLSFKDGQKVRCTYKTLNNKTAKKPTTLEGSLYLFQKKTIGSKKNIPLFTKLLHEDETAVRAYAAAVLGVTKLEKAIPPLKDALKDSAYHVRLKAAEALGRIGSKKALPALITALKDENNNVRRTAVYAIGKIPAVESAETLIDFSERVAGNERGEVLKVLGNFKTEKVVKHLIKFLNDTDKLTRKNAAAALSKTGRDTAVNPLFVALADKEKDVRFAALAALGKIKTAAARNALIKALYFKTERDTDTGNDIYGPGFKIKVAKALSDYLPRGVEPELINVLNEGNNPERLESVKILGKINSQTAINALFKAAGDTDVPVRREAVKILGEKKSTGFTDLFIHTLNNDVDNSVQEEAAKALGRINSNRSVKALIDFLQDTPDRKLGFLIADLLTASRSREAIEALVNMIGENNPTANFIAQVVLPKIKSLEIFGKIKSGETINILIDSLQNRHRDLAFKILCEIKSDVAVNKLIPLLNTGDYKLQNNIIAIMGNAGTFKAGVVLLEILQDSDNSRNVRNAAARALGKTRSNRVIRSLGRVLTDEDVIARFGAVEALGETQSGIAVGLLIQAMNDTEYSIRRAAVRVLGKKKSPAAIPALIAVLNHKESALRQEAAEALGNFRQEQVVDALINALEDRESAVVRSAANSLKKIGSDKALTALKKTIPPEPSASPLKKPKPVKEKSTAKKAVKLFTAPELRAFILFTTVIITILLVSFFGGEDDKPRPEKPIKDVDIFFVSISRIALGFSSAAVLVYLLARDIGSIYVRHHNARSRGILPESDAIYIGAVIMGSIITVVGIVSLLICIIRKNRFKRFVIGFTIPGLLIIAGLILFGFIIGGVGNF